MTDSRVFRTAVTAIVLIALWELVVIATGVPRYILPGPWSVVLALKRYAGLI